MSIIRVNQEFLRGAAADLDELAGELMRISAVRGSVSTAPVVEAAHAEFENRWDERRGELANELNSLASSALAIVDSFDEADDTQAKHLRDMVD